MKLAFAVDSNCIEGLDHAVRSFARFDEFSEILVYAWDDLEVFRTKLSAEALAAVTLIDGQEVIQEPWMRALITRVPYFQIMIPFMDQRDPNELVLFFDHDVACLRPLAPYLPESLDGKSAAMAIDFTVHARTDGPKVENERIDRAGNLVNFNSGALLSSPALMQAQNYCARALRFFADNEARCLVHDQDALNHVFGDDCLELHPHLNWQTTAQRYFPDVAPAVAHFTGKHKPWIKFSPHHSAEIRKLYGGQPEQQSFGRALRRMQYQFSPSHRARRKLLALTLSARLTAR